MNATRRRRKKIWMFGLSLAIACAIWITPTPPTWATSAAASTDAAETPSDAQLDRLDALVTRTENIYSIKKLIYVFGYYRDRFLDDEVLSLFTDSAVADADGGKYIGKNSVRRLITGPHFKMAEAVGKQGPQPGLLNDHIIMQEVIDVDPSGVSAKARFKDWFVQAVHGKSQTMGSMIYEGEFRKEDGIWRISALTVCPRYDYPYLGNLRDTPVPNIAPPVPKFYPADPQGPDRQSNTACHPWPFAGITPPFHYVHPVTGDRINKP